MFPAFRAQVEASLRAALETLGYPTSDLGLEEPPEEVDAILASSVAFRLAGPEEPPPAVAAEIAEAVDLSAASYVAAVTALGPYVNFSPADSYYGATLEAAQESGFGRRPDTGETVLVEHTSANPTGPIHVGRARNPIIGDALARLLRMAGHDVTVHYYVNDAGRQLALFTWAYETFDESDLEPSTPARDRPDYDLVRYYRKGNEYLESAPASDTDAAEAEIAAILEGLDRGDPDTIQRVSRVVDQVLEGMQTTLDRLPAHFDEWIRETRFLRPPAAGGEQPPDGFTDPSATSWTEDVTARLRDLEEAVYQDGAWQLDLSEHGIEKNLVFERSDGTSLYATRDIAHHEWKLAQYDRAIGIFGEDHELQARQVRTALDLLGAEDDRIRTVLHSWVNLPGGEGMSTRSGTGIDLDDLLDEAQERARQAVEDRLDTRSRGDLTPDDVERIAREVGIGAVRYDIVATQPTKAITFRWEDALDFEAQSAPYVQYAHARACGILEGADPADAVETVAPLADHLETTPERALLRQIARFPAVVEDAAESLEPHRVATYVRELADAFNDFYRACPVLEAEDELFAARVALVVAARHALADGLDVLGIAAPESM